MTERPQQVYYEADKRQSLQAWLNGQAWRPNDVWGWGIETPLDRVYWEPLYHFYYAVFNFTPDHEVVEVGGIPLISSYSSRSSDSFLPSQIGNWIARADQEWAILIGQEAVGGVDKYGERITNLFNRVVGVEVMNQKAFERDWLVLKMATS